MKRRQVERHLRSYGCRPVGGGKHEKWRGPQGQVGALPRHREIGPGLVRSLCRQLGVPPPQGSR
ncbi:MAG: type II toxin-antitoxin system HicA family toxin [Solirubrobacterales bacterium]